MQGIIWLASYPKSGNTWIRAFLANLFSGEAEPVSFERMSLYFPGEARTMWYRHFLGDDFSIDDNEEVSRRRTEVQAKLAGTSQTPTFVKTHSYLGQAYGHEIFNMNATLGAIYIIRNPLDVVLSAAPHYDLSIDDTIELMANEQMRSEATDTVVFEKVTDWSTHVSSWTQAPNPALLVLRYEDMLQKPQHSFTKLTRFLKFKTSKKDILRAIRNASFKSLKSMEEKNGFAERPEHSKGFFRKGETGQWREALSEEQVRKIIRTHRKQMMRFNYIPKDFA